MWRGFILLSDGESWPQWSGAMFVHDGHGGYSAVSMRCQLQAMVDLLDSFRGLQSSYETLPKMANRRRDFSGVTFPCMVGHFRRTPRGVRDRSSNYEPFGSKIRVCMAKIHLPTVPLDLPGMQST